MIISVWNRIWQAQLPQTVIGLGVLFGVWWLCGLVIAAYPELGVFAGFAPLPAFRAFWQIVLDGDALTAIFPSLYRVLMGMVWAIILGAPLGLIMGYLSFFEQSARVPFQLLRMVSPLSWMPVAVLVFVSWDGAIIFLIAAAAIWPIIFATSAGVKWIDPAWVIAGRSHGGRGYSLVRHVIIPAVLPNLLSGVRIALGTAWIVLVPAEYLGVTSGLGYAINDARDTLSYDVLAAFILLIGVIGFFIDALLEVVLKRVHWVSAD